MKRFNRSSMAATKMRQNYRTRRRTQKYNYKTALGANKGRTARAISRHTAISSAIEASSRNSAANERELGRAQAQNEILNKLLQIKQQQNSTNKPSNSGSTNIIDWIN